MQRRRLVVVSALVILSLLLITAPHLAARQSAPNVSLKDGLNKLKGSFALIDKGGEPCPVQNAYDVVAAMQIECNAADQLWARLSSSHDAASEDAKLLAKIHAMMKSAAVIIDYPDLYDVHDLLMKRYLSNAGYVYGASGTLKDLLGEPDVEIGGTTLWERYQSWEKNRGDYVRQSTKCEFTLDQSKRPGSINNLTVRSGTVSCTPRRFAESLTLQLRYPIVRNHFIKYYRDEAEKLGIEIRPEDYFETPTDRKGTAEWIRKKEAAFASEPVIHLKSGVWFAKQDKSGELEGSFHVPAGDYLIYMGNLSGVQGTSLTVPKPSDPAETLRFNWKVEGESLVDVTAVHPETRLSARDLRPQFKLLDFRVGTNKETQALEGAIGGRMFQRFGRHLALQTQGEFEFNKQRDFLDLDRLLQVLTGQKFVPREQRGLTDFSSKECQFDVGPVLRFGRAQFAVMQSLRYVKRDSFDQGGLLGQWFFNAGYLFNRGQVGFFATKANLDEPVVKTVQFDQAFFEETYLKVTDQVGVNFQLAISEKAGYIEGTLGYLRPTQAKGAAGGTLRYVFPGQTLSKKLSKLSFTVEAGYNESYIRSSENSLRVAMGVRFGKWLPLNSFVQKNGLVQGPVPVMVPSIRYETLTRLVRLGNRKPVADAGPDQLNVDWRKGDVILDGSKSHDPDGDAISYTWSQQKGPHVDLIPNNNAVNPSFTAKNGEEYEFQLVVKDSYGLESDPSRVRITTLRIDLPVIEAFTVTPSTIYKKGDCQPNSATLAWKVTKQDPASTVTIAITNLSGPFNLVDQRSVSPDNTTSYTLTACNVVNECVSATVTLTVKPCGPAIITFKADPPEILAGKSSTLSWEVKDADRVTLTNGADGTTNPVLLKDTKQVTPAKTTVYTLTACNVASECVSASVTVTVKSLPTIVTFKADPPEILAGKSSTLSWKVENANRVTLTNGENRNSVEVRSVVPSYPVSPKKTTVYTLTACNAASECVSANVTVTVKSLPTIVTFKADPPEISEGNSSMLSWKVDNADRVTLTNVSSPLVDPVGSLQVKPTKTTVYTLTACSAGGECVSANVTVQVHRPLNVKEFSANPNAIQRGNCSLLTWVVENAVRVTLYSTTGEVWNVTGLSSKSVCPTQTTSYYLFACDWLGRCETRNDVTVEVTAGR